MKQFLKLLILSCAFVFSSHSHASITVVDVIGRTVEIEKPAKKVIIGEGRFISIFTVLGIQQPISRIAGMMNEFKLYDPDTYAAYQQVYPEVDQVPYFGGTSADSVSVEKILLLNPDLAIFGVAGHGPSAESNHIVEKLEAANIPVVFVDFRQDPTKNTAKSVEIVGKLLGEPEKADEFAAFYQKSLKNITEIVAGIPDSEYPSILFELKADSSQPCCLSVGQGMFAEMANVVGGRSIATDLLPGPVGEISYEHALSADFDVYIGTAIGTTNIDPETTNLLLAGVGVTQSQARESLANFIVARKFEGIKAIKNNNAYSLWHHFYNSPLNLYAIERMAKWLHPSLFNDLDPDETLNTLLSGAKPVDLFGAYSVSINEESN